MAQVRRPLERLLPEEGSPPRRLLLLSFALWPVCLLLLIRGLAMGLSTLAMLGIPICILAFRRLWDLFPRRSPARVVMQVFSGLYMVVIAWLVLARFDVVGLGLIALVAGSCIHTLLRPDVDGVPTVESMSDIAQVQWAVEHALPGSDDDSGPGSGSPRRFHWPEG